VVYERPQLDDGDDGIRDERRDRLARKAVTLHAA
jgi:hypothetical protein